MNASDTLLLMFCTLLVWIMTPGLALFYGGLVQSKNVLTTAMHSMSAIMVVTLTWIILGFSLSFGGSHTLIGDLSFFMLNDVNFDVHKDFSETVPFSLIMLFQLTFCTIAVSILTGSVAERMKFIPFLIFMVLWVVFVYSPVAHWVWGGGWIHQLGAIDYAGGTVVHISSGVSGLVLALMLGSRNKQNMKPPHNLMTTLIGGILIWFGWFGFNAGSSLSLNEISLLSLVNTFIASNCGVLGWVILEYVTKQKVTLIGTLSGMLAGLVTITPAAGYVSYTSSIILGIVGGMACYYVITHLKILLNYDDALDAFGLHGVGGIIGAIGTGLFQQHSVNGDIVDGLLFGGGFYPVFVQVVAVVATIAFSVVMTFLIATLIGRFTQLRTSKHEESKGLDHVFHGEHAYNYEV
ncbi:ammonium transporter [Staphylococcus massiliensis]|uniref:Ammonium transporter n=1 Tax=Staphylococcus massiliensis S46 TaxID=1229783 RepID=K9B8P1_9STAP|nr:ammonium transporter [Staphylococcus massiliensis]EKU50145.1 probabale ammonium transporter [Staphylococcus massiliensis S46]MCG3400435.1 ammonium transporter [Staphylococcus massiliensis]MCG3402152.1 ammonium transporter [Staphylococcus massiliensis]MCG3412881.1 ammonium transporter [Staphylococcus massiliensis]POA00839.1 ammonium transporter [Staphylococcus massiliensis CCUG 55927]